MDHAIQGLMDSAMNNIKAMVDVDTVVGDSVTCDDGTIIIPISSVCFGFGAGGSDFAPKAGSAVSEKMFGGGCGGGANVKPAGFLIVSNGNVRYLPVSGSASAFDKLVDLMPGMIDKVNKVISGRKTKKQENQKEAEKIEIID
ncbi:MAG: GerW family sporulation protein [Clostridia bacterium]|nr:GerW family sporulation protein [Clostridia bacterium]